MPELKNRQFLEFEKPVKDLYDQLEILPVHKRKSKADMSSAIGGMKKG